ncbi:MULTISPECIES: septation ring formation regulator EzrA [unclassified Bacillus (in: firmicutes)]|uniref:septation ring formation regulator EzrA n=1 Tax=unclassified Bacillus (in: firmicutes) TaxID=185979 RepID=UPI001BE65587|nr:MULTISPECIES: septation ring formation regulator EzrA [unclassified Bacillus (in: firmicutes)]MBT2638460.1 septation ring formation regulator EzrA [Bacillus sp. ISL-39]MBT2662174.1 septation ring formation regulator EzrA [Bacillus sp. ISL-45]
MEYIIGGIALLIILFLSGYFMKRKYYSEVDRYESWKIDIMNRPVLDEMSKVKQLNMTGQTEELFERWRQEWDELVTSKLPGIEDYLFDAEEYIDKYRFKKAKESLAVIERRLTETEDKIKKILGELNELVGSEEKNREEIDGLKEQYRDNKKNLLSHRHSFGSAEASLEAMLENIQVKFVEFDEKTENGNYLEAREIVLSIQAMLEQVSSKMESIPVLLHDCQSVIPSQVSELKDGVREMTVQGYVLDHLNADKEVEEISKELTEYIAYLEKGDVEAAEQGIQGLKERVENLFDILEEEVMAKQYITKTEHEAKEILVKAITESKTLKEETKHIQESYHLNDKELSAQTNVEQQLKGLLKRFELIDHRITENDTAQSLIKQELEEAKEQLDKLVEEQKVLMEKLSALRKDEMAAREKVRDLSKKISELIRTVSKSNMPGLSQEYKYLLEDANESIKQVNEKLEQKPLDIPVVQQYLEISVLTVEKLEASTEEIVETVMLAERVIQYGNRYRSRYPSVDRGLREAEEHFRNYDYREALEQAATSIEEVDPGALNRIEQMISEKE